MPTKVATQLLASFVLVSLLCLPSAAQQNPPQSSTPSSAAPGQAQSRAKNRSEEEKQIEKKEQSQRVLGVVPQFAVTSRQDAPPMTAGQKFHLLRAVIDPATLTIVGLQAGLSQAENEFPAYGQGAEGYAKRYRASLADNASTAFWSNFFYPVLLKQDPRYFRLGKGSIAHRLFLGARQEFWCRDDRGRRVVNWSSILGAFTSGAVSNLYYPGNTLISITPATATTPAMPRYENDRGVILTLSRSLIALGYGTAGDVFDEFWPDIHNKLFHKHPPTAEPAKTAP